ncbi:hypothetical protein FB565_005025 [Actinoplanes lutulentus]|uniref:Uncharacterized protein DUF3152 n=1 Tax=Actinoplanes lutulentus TaxID=1287878 RepID=A0A327ZI97_9ACTN|nr:DUF3152 domain-containing protein [Actinoplanes lutulentus]MBB2945292.1 hypothetical protein [Actinoplanes lutulentus]RAK40573.1 uncharacterized protein DUF3152 [Actinoplanes lutulentus]
MISSAPPTADRWRQSWLVILAATLVLLIAVVIGNQMTADPSPVGNAAAAASPSPAVSTPPVASVAPSLAASPSAPILESASASPSPTSPFPAAGLLRLSGSVPTKASGHFLYASQRGPIVGSKGQVRRFRVAVEKGSNEDAEVFAAQVQAILGDKRSWIGNGNVRLQMVTGADKADFTVYLATRDTAGQMCAQGGTNIRVGGVPYTSCRTTGKAIINLDRWRLSAKPYLDAKINLATYRQYVINHEVGHELGHGHQGCPKAGGPAPVMVQQTLTLRGCVPYAWPRRDNRNFAGPSI